MLKTEQNKNCIHFKLVSAYGKIVFEIRIRGEDLHLLLASLQGFLHIKYQWGLYGCDRFLPQLGLHICPAFELSRRHSKPRNDLHCRNQAQSPIA